MKFYPVWIVIWLGLHKQRNYENVKIIVNPTLYFRNLATLEATTENIFKQISTFLH